MRQMRRLSLVVALVLLASTGAMAQTAQLSAGAYHGNLSFPDDGKSSGFGLYVSGEVAPAGLPIGLSASYAAFGADKVTYDSGDQNREHTVNVIDLLAGYRVFRTVTVGGGWASFSYDDKADDTRDLTSQGIAVGAFASYPFDGRIDARAKVFYVPSAKVESDSTAADEGTMLGFSVSGSYQLNQTFGIEAGYRSLQVKLENDDTYSTGGLFVGATFSF